MHAFFRGLFVVGLLEKDSYFGVWEAEMAVDVAAYFRQGSSAASSAADQNETP